MTEKEKIELIADRYGYEPQSRQCIEEMAELTQAINKLWRMRNGGNDKQYIRAAMCLIEEMADVTIMLRQLEYLLGVTEPLQQKIEEKINRQMKRIGVEPEYIKLTEEQAAAIDAEYLKMCQEVAGLREREHERHNEISGQ